MRKLGKIYSDVKKFVYYVPEDANAEMMKRLFEQEISLYKFLKKYLPKDPVCVDIGTRDGDSLFSILPLLTEKSYLTCFEPNKKEFDYIEKNLKANNIVCPYILNNFGISKKTGQQKFLIDNTGRNAGLETEQIKIGEWENEIMWPCKEPEDFDDYTIETIVLADYIKVDTEGYDMDIIELLFKYIALRPYLLIENWPQTADKIKTFCNKKRYLIINPQTYEIVSFLNDEHATQNLFLIPREKFTYET